MEDIEFQKKHLGLIYRDASMAPCFKGNPKYCIGKFADVTPYIRYDDVMNHLFVIRARPYGESINSFDNEERQIIVEYDSMDSLINDGWRLD